MLIFNLKKIWYEEIRSGEKRIEYREVKPYWTARLKKAVEDLAVSEFFDKPEIGDLLYIGVRLLSCVFRLGYTKRQMTAEIIKIEVVNGKKTDLKIDKPVYAIYLNNVKELAE